MIIKTEPDIVEQYTSDASNFRGKADLVYIPKDYDELLEAVINCIDKKIPYTVSGAGTGLSGGRVPLEGSVISMEKLNKILKIDAVNHIAVVQPGVLLTELEDELKNIGCFYPPNPTEKNSSLGGNVAANSSGARTYKYGSTRDYVMGLKLILPNGKKLTFKRGDYSAENWGIKFQDDEGNSYNLDLPDIHMPAIKHSAGYYIKDGVDLVDLFVGSEGTLGVVEEIELRFIKKPAHVLGLVIFFDDERKLFEFVDEIRNLKGKSMIDPRLIEFFDRESLLLMKKKHTEIPDNPNGAIWIEQEYEEEREYKVMTGWYSLISEFTALADKTWSAMNDNEHEKFREFRHELPLQVNEIIVRNNSRKFGTDVAVPNNGMYEIFIHIREAAKRSSLPYVIYGHIGNSHFHGNVFAHNEKELEAAVKFYDSVMDKALELGGTVSGEHGIGKLKKKYLLKMFGKEGIVGMKNIKRVLDPYFLLGRGNLFD